MNKKVAILIGSETDRLTMEAANKYYEFFGIEYEIHVKSAHRNPSDVEDFAKKSPWSLQSCSIPVIPNVPVMLSLVTGL